MKREMNLRTRLLVLLLSVVTVWNLLSTALVSSADGLLSAVDEVPMVVGFEKIDYGTLNVPFGTAVEDVLSALPTTVNAIVEYSNGRRETVAVSGYWEDEENWWGYGYGAGVYDPEVGGQYMFDFWSEEFDTEENLAIDWSLDELNDPMGYPHLFVNLGTWVEDIRIESSSIEVPLNTPFENIPLPQKTVKLRSYTGSSATVSVPMTWTPDGTAYRPDVAGLYRYKTGNISTTYTDAATGRSFLYSGGRWANYTYSILVGPFMQSVSAPEITEYHFEYGEEPNTEVFPKRLNCVFTDGTEGTVGVRWEPIPPHVYADRVLQAVQDDTQVANASAVFPTIRIICDSNEKDVLRVEYKDDLMQANVEEIPQPMNVSCTSKGLDFFLTVQFSDVGEIKERSLKITIPKGFRLKELTGGILEEMRSETGDFLYLKTTDVTAEKIADVIVLDSHGNPYGTTALGESTTFFDYSGTVEYRFTKLASTVELAFSLVPYLPQMSFTDSYMPLTETVQSGLWNQTLPKGTKVEIPDVLFTLTSGNEIIERSFSMHAAYTDRGSAYLTGSLGVTTFLEDAEPGSFSISKATFDGTGGTGPNSIFGATMYRWADCASYPLAAYGEEYWLYTVPAGIYINSVNSQWKLVSAVQSGGIDVTASSAVGYVTQDQTVFTLQYLGANISSQSGTGPWTFRMVGGYYSPVDEKKNKATIYGEVFARLYDAELNDQRYIYGKRTMTMNLVVPQPNVATESWTRYPIDWNWYGNYNTVYNKSYHIGGFMLGNSGLAETGPGEVELTFPKDVGLCAVKLPGLYDGGTASNITVTTKAGKVYHVPDLSGETTVRFRFTEDAVEGKSGSVYTLKLDAWDYPAFITYHLSTILPGHKWAYGNGDWFLGYCVRTNGTIEGVILNQQRNSSQLKCVCSSSFAFDPETVYTSTCTISPNGYSKVDVKATLDKGTNSYYPGDIINMHLSLSVPTDGYYLDRKSCSYVNPTIYARIPYRLVKTGERLFELNTNIVGKSSVGEANFTANYNGTKVEDGIEYKIYKITVNREHVEDVGFEFSWCESIDGQDNSASIDLSLFTYLDNPCDQNWDLSQLMFIAPDYGDVYYPGARDALVDLTGQSTKTVDAIQGRIYCSPQRALKVDMRAVSVQDPADFFTYTGSRNTILPISQGDGYKMQVNWRVVGDSDYHAGTSIYIPLAQKDQYYSRYFNDTTFDDSYNNFTIPEMDVLLTGPGEVLTGKGYRDKMDYYYATSVTLNDTTFNGEKTWSPVIAEKWLTAAEVEDWSKVVMIKGVARETLKAEEIGGIELPISVMGETGSVAFLRSVSVNVLQENGQSSLGQTSVVGFTVAGDTLDGLVWLDENQDGIKQETESSGNWMTAELTGVRKIRNPDIRISLGQVPFLEETEVFAPVVVRISPDGVMHLCNTEGSALFLTPGDYSLRVISTDTTGLVENFAKTGSSAVTRTVDPDGTVRLTGTWRSDVSVEDEETPDIAVYRFTVEQGETRAHVVGVGLVPAIYHITYDKNAETAVGTQTDSSGYLWNREATVLDQGTMVNPGYAFAGWALTSSGMVAYTPGDTFTITQNTVLYAKWTEYVTVTLTGEKTLSGGGKTNADITAGMFSFNVTRIDSNGIAVAGVPSSAVLVKADRSLDFGTWSFSKPGTYKFTISENDVPAGYTKAEPVDVTVVVTLNEETNKLETEVTCSKATGITFLNTYAQTPVTVVPTVEKQVNGKHADKETFTFVLEATSSAFPMPVGSNATLASILDSGSAAFGSITFDKEGIYSYTVREIAGTAAGYTYDTAVYTLTYTVTDSGSVLVADLTVTDAQHTVQSSAVFVNTYATPDTLIAILDVDRTAAEPGDALTYTVTLTNTGSSALTGIHVRDYIPENTSFRSVVGSTGVYVPDGARGHVDWFVERLGAGESISFRFTVNVNTEAQDNALISDTALFTVTESTVAPDFAAAADPDKTTNTVQTVVVVPVIPYTGDNTVWFVIVAAVSLFGMGYVAKRKNDD